MYKSGSLRHLYNNNEAPFSKILSSNDKPSTSNVCNLEIRIFVLLLYLLLHHLIDIEYHIEDLNKVAITSSNHYFYIILPVTLNTHSFIVWNKVMYELAASSVPITAIPYG